MKSRVLLEKSRSIAQKGVSTELKREKPRFLESSLSATVTMRCNWTTATSPILGQCIFSSSTSLPHGNTGWVGLLYLTFIGSSTSRHLVTGKFCSDWLICCWDKGQQHLSQMLVSSGSEYCPQFRTP